MGSSKETSASLTTKAKMASQKGGLQRQINALIKEGESVPYELHEKLAQVNRRIATLAKPSIAGPNKAGSSKGEDVEVGVADSEKEDSDKEKATKSQKTQAAMTLGGGLDFDLDATTAVVQHARALRFLTNASATRKSR
ncbi:MAG: hypothetical protein ASARMPREDX12_006483 [Alectoria sarmentosa]|nr:MAG: hypothetical protein ASARMPRED_004217 [Alectoria sarmentosa]CAD6574261.1 MAG: hypothetical protein ASARMPREDX12_006483 [Alectoria sarmentosa]